MRSGWDGHDGGHCKDIGFYLKRNGKLLKILSDVIDLVPVVP